MPEDIQHFRNSKSSISRKNFVTNLFYKIFFELGDNLNNLFSGNCGTFSLL